MSGPLAALSGLATALLLMGVVCPLYYLGYKWTSAIVTFFGIVLAFLFSIFVIGNWG